MTTMKMKAIAAVGMTTAAASIGFAATAHAKGAVNLPVTDDIRAQRVEAEADPATSTHWAAKALVATSFQAGVNLQNQNSYMIFRQPAGGRWVPYGDGYRMKPCPLPVEVLGVWQWPAGKCGPGTAQPA
ncbi:MAG: hypothetical protein JOZ49_11380 [Mycolicibacterium sp.]|nr:hypothetical protein [Mycolicibacterium sp.]